MIELSLALELTALVDRPLPVGRTPRGLRRVVPIVGGSFAGPRLAGRIVPGGADWQFERADGVLEAEARYELETHDGVVISVVNRGLRRASEDVMHRLAAGDQVDPRDYYFRTTPTFEAPAGPYEWLNESIFVGSGERRPDSVVIRVYEVL